MSKKDVPKVKKMFSFLPAWIWCIGLDILDGLPNIITGIISALGVTIPGTIGVDAVIDFIIMGLGLLIFDDFDFIIWNPDLILPPVLDAFPSYTAKYLYRRFYL